MDPNPLAIDLKSIADPGMRRCIEGLLNIIQQQAEQIRKLQATNQQLRDEIARLKGEQPKPNFPPSESGKNKPTSNYSSEKQREAPKPKSVRREAIQVDRTERCEVDKASLPSDAQYRGTETRIVQEILVRRDNVAFECEKFYSPSLHKTFLAPLPQGFDGYFFGPCVRAMALTLYNAMGTSEPKIREWFAHVGVFISAGELSNLLIHDIEPFHQEKAEVQRAGLASSPWHHIDDTSSRVDGVGLHCQILGNPLYTIYCTTLSKDRLTILRVLQGQDGLRFVINGEAIALARKLGVSEQYLDQMSHLPLDTEMDEAAFLKVFAEVMGPVCKTPRHKMIEAAAIAAYHAQTDVPVVDTLLSDDARQFSLITFVHALCWIHEGRHYTKLTPCVPAFQEELEQFQNKFWDYYRKLQGYRQKPSPQAAAQLEAEFDALFSEAPAYEELAERIKSTRENKQELLVVLIHPELPLHNNEVELAARARARKRDVSFGARTDAGSRAWDTMQSLVGTAKKLGLNVYEYISDRVRKLGNIPRLADLIHERAEQMKLGASWAAPIPSG